MLLNPPNMTNEIETIIKSNEYCIKQLVLAVGTIEYSRHNQGTADEISRKSKLVNEYYEKLESELRSHLTELLQGLIVEIEGEKSGEHKYCDEYYKKNSTDNSKCCLYQEVHNSALNLAQERIKKLIK